MVTSGRSRRSSRAAASRAIHLRAEGLRLAQRRGREFVRQVKARDRRLGGELHRAVRIQPLARLRPARRTPNRRAASRVAMTQSPPLAPCRSCGATAQRSCRRRSAAFTQALRPWTSTVPRKAVTPRSSTVSTAPDQRSVGVARNLHAQAIAVHHAAHLRRRQKDAVLEAFDAQEAVAGAIGADVPLRPSRPERTPV